MNKILSERIPQLSLNDFVKDVTMGKIGSDLMDTTKKIALIRHVGIRKTKLISSPLQNESDLLVSPDQNPSNEDDLDDTLEIKSDTDEHEDKIESMDDENAGKIMEEISDNRS
jgi:small subunit ribosomal protein S3Ae